MIESDVVLVANKDRLVIEKDVFFEESDHHHFKDSGQHKRLYPRPAEKGQESW
jgi:hypothetical protein